MNDLYYWGMLVGYFCVIPIVTLLALAAFVLILRKTRVWSNRR